MPPPMVEHDAICGPFWARFRLTHPTWFAEREWFRKHPYDEAQSCTQDRVLMLQTHREACFAAVPEVVLAYRQDSFPLRKALPMRIQYAKALWRDGLQHHEPGRAAAAVILEASKLGVDLGSACLRVNHRYAGGAASPVDTRLEADWRTFWLELNAA